MEAFNGKRKPTVILIQSYAEQIKEKGLLLQWNGLKKAADQPDVGEIAKFHKAELKKTEPQEKNTLLTKQTTQQEKWSAIS
uniref:thymosin beta-10-like n=1 Tax=Jaculus jaculus TaxID=51337 RepID=UPI001E1B4280|nr:thymosin beta-10-like [Jaculus jaculus]